MTLRAVLPGPIEVYGEPVELAQFVAQLAREATTVPAPPVPVAPPPPPTPPPSPLSPPHQAPPPRPAGRQALRTDRLNPAIVRGTIEAYAAGTPVGKHCDQIGYRNRELLSAIVTDAVRNLGGERGRGAQCMDPRAVEAWHGLSSSEQLELVESTLKGGAASRRAEPAARSSA